MMSWRNINFPLKISEYWNNGKLEFWVQRKSFPNLYLWIHYSSIPVFQRSIIPCLSKWPRLPVDLGPYPETIEAKWFKQHDQDNNQAEDNAGNIGKARHAHPPL